VEGAEGPAAAEEDEWSVSRDEWRGAGRLWEDERVSREGRYGRVVPTLRIETPSLVREQRKLSEDAEDDNGIEEDKLKGSLPYYASARAGSADNDAATLSYAAQRLPLVLPGNRLSFSSSPPPPPASSLETCFRSALALGTQRIHPSSFTPSNRAIHCLPPRLVSHGTTHNSQLFSPLALDSLARFASFSLLLSTRRRRLHLHAPQPSSPLTLRRDRCRSLLPHKETTMLPLEAATNDPSATKPEDHAAAQLQTDKEQSDEERRVVRKLDFILMPILLISCTS
jgi:hypothetical protein